jgi:cytochrome c peroxidase
MKTAVAALGIVALVACQQQAPEEKPEKKDPGAVACVSQGGAGGALDSPDEIELGKELYFDVRLSKTGTQSCLTCHDVLAGGADGRARSTLQDGSHTSHSAPTVWNARYYDSFFWYGTSDSLEHQAVGPLSEMAKGDLAWLTSRVDSIGGYHDALTKLYGGVDMGAITSALAAYERTLVTDASPYDRFVAGNTTALSGLAQDGAKLFDDLGCGGCHVSPHFTTSEFKRFPVFDGTAFETQYDLKGDPGRNLATNKEADRYFWRVPTLRNIALTAPYFHAGQVKTLGEAVTVMAKVQLDVDLSPDQVDALVAFLDSLTGAFPEQTMPRLPSMENVSPF